MNDIDVEYCFYDDPDYVGDADRDSHILQGWHAQLWSKALPGGDQMLWSTDQEFPCLTHGSHLGAFRVSSDTIATTHANYSRSRIPEMWAELGSFERNGYERGFYRIGGFIVFPRHDRSINQLRGSNPMISDRFDLTLECIRRHYLGTQENPLGEVLQRDAAFFSLFGAGPDGFATYVEFFHLQDLIDGDSIRWFDEFKGEHWSFDVSPLPRSAAAYRLYLDNVLAFVTARGARIAAWCALGSNE